MSRLQLIFIFSTHVFDVGDLVLIDDQVLFVREFGLFSTTFRRVDGMEVIAPNALLSSAKLVHNLRRSNSMCVVWLLNHLRCSMIWLLLGGKRQIFTSRTTLRWRSSSNSGNASKPMSTQTTANGRTPMSTSTRWSTRTPSRSSSPWSVRTLSRSSLPTPSSHWCSADRSSWQDWGGRWGRRTEFMRNLKTVLEELDVRYTMPVQPIVLPRDGGMPPSRGGAPGHPSAGGYDESLGNAGFFTGSPIARAPTRSIRPGPDRF